MPRSRFFVRAALIATLAACAGCTSAVGCGTAISIGPTAWLFYPAPGATNVPDDLSTLVYATSGRSVPITLTAPGSSPVGTVPAELPSPLPTPLASPTPSGTTSLYAVALPKLTAKTSYAVIATEFANGCDASSTQALKIGSFTTQ